MNRPITFASREAHINSKFTLLYMAYTGMDFDSSLHESEQTGLLVSTYPWCPLRDRGLM